MIKKSKKTQLNYNPLEKPDKSIFAMHHMTPQQPDCQAVTSFYFHITWLPIQQRIKFKIGVLVYRCLRGTAPPYLSEMLSAAADIAGRRSLRSAAHGDLVVPRSRTVRFGSRMFAVSGPTFWNSLTNELKSSSLTEPAFKKQLKTFLFRTV